MATRTTYLMYHELQRPGRGLCYPDEGYARYVISEERFREHLHALKEAGFAGLSVGGHLGRKDASQPAVVFTFDDGCETDFLVAAPLLKEFGFSATFYVVSDWVGKSGFLSLAQMRELSCMGFEIGSHSRSHLYLSDLGADEVHQQVDGSKHALEEMLGKPVHHFSCPGGRWNDYSVKEAHAAGYRSFALSRVGMNTPDDSFALARVAIKAGTSASTAVAWAQGKGMFRMKAVTGVLDAGKVVLGNKLYERVRGRVLGSH